MKRTDVHRPTALVTEDYEFSHCYDAHPIEGDRRYTVQIVSDLVNEGWRFGQVHGGDTCDHCGHALRYVAVLKHLPTRTLIKVGEQCLDNRFSLATPAFHALRKAASLNRERMKKADKMAEFLSIPDNATAYNFLKTQVEDNGNYGWNGFYHDLLSKANRYAELSERQVEAVLKAKVRDEEFAARKAAEKETLTDVVEGKQSIAGKILSVKNVPGFQGEDVTKMLVLDDRQFKIWGTVPRSILDAAWDDSQLDDGDWSNLVDYLNHYKPRVEFNATVKVSDKDSTYGFYSRPTKAKLVG